MRKRTNIDPKAVIFDMDGVFVDTGPQHYAARHKLFAEVGHDFSVEEFRSTFGQRTIDILRQVLPSFSNGDLQRLDAKKEEYYREIVRQGLEPAPGLLLLLRDLRARGYRTAIGTAGPSENVMLILGVLNLKTALDVTITAEDVSRGKPDPQVFLIAARRLRVAPARSVVIEDAPAGIEAARTAGMCSIAVATTHPPEELARADVVAKDLVEVTGEMVDWLLEGERDAA